MSSLHVETKRKIKEINKFEFKILIDKLMLSDIEEQMMVMIYLKHKTMNQIAYDLGYSEIRIKKMHQRILKKIAKFL